MALKDNIISESDIGNLFELLNEYAKGKNLKYKYLSNRWSDFQQWRIMARSKVFELLNYFPTDVPLDASVLKKIERNDYIQEEIEFNTALSIRVRGSILIPKMDQERYPAIIAIHDHGAFYYYGREKVIEMDDEPSALTKFKRVAYGGKSYANDLVKRGYVVLCIDGFYFGTRRLDIERVSKEMFGVVTGWSLKGLEPGTEEYINTYNLICKDFEMLVVKHILASGTTWPGILLHDDRKCIDYLFTRKEVDVNRIACCGLSIGGYRAAFLAALDDRIKAAVVTGWMPTFYSLLYNRLRHHTYMCYIPNLTSFMELSDVMALAAPKFLFIQQCAKDHLFDYGGMVDACREIAEVYKKIGLSEKYKYEFYENDHEFNLKMQNDAFRWLDTVL